MLNIRCFCCVVSFVSVAFELCFYHVFALFFEWSGLCMQHVEQTDSLEAANGATLPPSAGRRYIGCEDICYNLAVTCHTIPCHAVILESQQAKNLDQHQALLQPSPPLPLHLPLPSVSIATIIMARYGCECLICTHHHRCGYTGQLGVGFFMVFRWDHWLSERHKWLWITCHQYFYSSLLRMPTAGVGLGRTIAALIPKKEDENRIMLVARKPLAVRRVPWH